MGRAALLALLLLAAPAAASAQAPGGILLDNGWAYPNYVNAAACAGLAGVHVRWNAALVNGFTAFPAGGVYTLYASNQAVPATGSCPTANNTVTGLIVLPVMTMSGAAGLVADATVSGDQLVTGSSDTIADCGSIADQVVYLCVQGTASGWAFGFATGSIVVSTGRPPAPVLTSVMADDAAVMVAWEPGTATSATPADSVAYVIEATAVATTAAVYDPVPLHTSTPTATTARRLSGLVNGVVYAVRARAISLAGNESDPSAVVTAMPAPTNESVFRPGAGGGSGGCGSGVAGPFGLAIVAAALALRSRRQRRR